MLLETLAVLDDIEEAMAQDVPTIVDVHVDPNAAPLPGKIVNEEAHWLRRWAYRSITEDKNLDFDQIPPISVAAKRFYNSCFLKNSTYVGFFYLKK